MSLLACGSYDFLFKPALPVPEAAVDNSSFEDLPVEERLAVTRRDLQHMKETLRMKESEHQDIEHELKFHAIKNEELMDVINAFRTTSADRSHEIMRAKAEQNSELTMQVHSLRDLLTKSGEQIAEMQRDLRERIEEGDALAATERAHKRLKVQLAGLLKTLNNVEVSSVEIPSEWINLQWITGGKNNKNNNKDQETCDADDTVQVITRKVVAVEADRKRLLKESELYSQSDGEKEQKIRDLERRLRKMQHDKDELRENNETLRQQLSVREGKIGALEELFQNINANRIAEGKKKSSGDGRYRPVLERGISLMNVDDDDDDGEGAYEDIDIDSLAAPSVGDDNSTTCVGQSFEDMFTSIWSNFTGGAASTRIKDRKIEGRIDLGASPSNEEEDQDISSCFNDSYHTKQVEEELQAAAQREIDELRESYESLTSDYEAAQFKISDLSARLEESVIRANSFEAKAELREGLLKDVIQQYKELQMEHSASNDRMVQLKRKVAVLLQLEKEREEQRKAQAAAAAKEAANPSDGKDVSKAPAVVIQAVGESPTFDMSERTGRTSVDDSDEGENESSSNPSVSLINGLDKNFVMEDYKRLESECDRLQTEFDSAIEKITDLEQSLKEANDEAQKSRAIQADQARTIALVEGDKTILQERIVKATAKMVESQSTHSQRTIQADNELKLAELREEIAKKKQLEREQDLWDVIEQYKKLADQNKSVEHEKAEVEHELFLTQKVKIQRRDLVYEYRKLEKSMEEAVETSEQLAKELQMARNEAAVNKEEARGVRKRLAGCHFHYKELQQQYDAILKQNEDLERRLAKAQKHEALHNTQAESWTAMMENVREKRRAAEERVDALTKENQELQQLFSELKGDAWLQTDDAASTEEEN